jgi:hypothetical protein
LLKKINIGLESKGGKRVSKQMDPHKQAGVAILIADKVDFRLKSGRRDKEGHFILIKRTIYKEEISIFNIYGPNIVAPNYIKKKSSGLKNSDGP